MTAEVPSNRAIPDAVSPGISPIVSITEGQMSKTKANHATPPGMPSILSAPQANAIATPSANAFRQKRNIADEISLGPLRPFLFLFALPGAFAFLDGFLGNGDHGAEQGIEALKLAGAVALRGYVGRDRNRSWFGRLHTFIIAGQTVILSTRALSIS
jgi:hypothetical protein